MPIQLLIANAIIIFGLIVSFGIGIFALVKSPKKGVAITFFLLITAINVFFISHIVGINAPNADVAWLAFMFNLTNIFIVCFNYHFIYLVFGERTKRRFWVLIGSYVSGAILLAFYLLYPHTFMGTPVPKLYMPFYYVDGGLYWVMRLHFIAVSGFFFYDLIKIYQTSNQIERNRIKYIFASLAFAYTLGSTAVLLVYDVPFDPMYSMFSNLYTIGFLYVFIKYDLLDIKILAKRALWYAAAVILIGLLIVLANAGQERLAEAVPGLPFWILPFVSACVVAAVGGFVWQQIREVDKLKYEFVTVVTHKFRTPLTYITWSAETLEKNHTDTEKENAVQLIKTATVRLNELTDLLIGLEKTEDTEYLYSFQPENLKNILEDCLANESGRIKEKNIAISKSYPDQPLMAVVDKRRLGFALQIIIENAISYTRNNGKIDISLVSDKKHAVINITDSGMGISKDELPYIFSKFFRGKHARLTDTEGMGIGLYIARQIIKNQHGIIRVDSKGEDKGATFTVTLPLV